MTARLLAAMAAALACATAVEAQTAPTAAAPSGAALPAAAVVVPAPVPASPSPSPSPHVAAGTYVLIELAETVSTKTVKQGDTFAIRLAAPVLLDGQTILPIGVVGVGQVVDVGRPGFGGKPGKLVLAARRLDYNGQTIPLRAMQLGATGVDNSGEALAVGFIPYVGLASLFIQGGDMELPVGIRARAKLVNDLFPPGIAPAPPTPSASPPVAALNGSISSSATSQGPTP